MVWYFIGVYIINRTLHGRLEIWNFSLSVEKYFTSGRSDFFNTRREILYISTRPCKILYLSFFFPWRQALVVMKKQTNKNTCRDFVTNSYGESWDSSCEKSWVQVKKSLKLKILRPLCNQTVYQKTDSKTLYYSILKLKYSPCI